MDVPWSMGHPNIFLQCINLIACMFSLVIYNIMCLGLVMSFFSGKNIAGHALVVNSWT